MPEVSVTLPCYNEEAWIGSAIESVLDQTMADLELIVVDDGSDDGTEAVVEEYDDDNRLRYVYQDNAGYPAAQNRALDEATGEYYAIMEADDLWEPEKLAEQLRSLEDSGRGMSHTNAYLIDESDEVTGLWHETDPPRYRDRERFMQRLLMGNFICNPTVMADQSAFDGRRFDDTYTLNSDHDMWLRIAGENEVDYVAEPLARKRFHGGNISGNYEELFENRKRLLESAVETFEYLEEVRDRKLASIHLTYGLKLVQDGHPRRGRGAIRTSLRHRPWSARAWGAYVLSYGGARLVDPLMAEG